MWFMKHCLKPFICVKTKKNKKENTVWRCVKMYHKIWLKDKFVLIKVADFVPYTRHVQLYSSLHLCVKLKIENQIFLIISISYQIFTSFEGNLMYGYETWKMSFYCCVKFMWWLHWWTHFCISIYICLGNLILLSSYSLI